MSGPQSENEKSFIIIMTSAATARIRQEHETVGNGFQSGTLSREMAARAKRWLEHGLAYMFRAVANRVVTKPEPRLGTSTLHDGTLTLRLLCR
jgi:hypothetical protein